MKAPCLLIPVSALLEQAPPRAIYLSNSPCTQQKPHTHTHSITHILRLAPLVTQGPGRHQSIMTLLRREVKNWIGESFQEILYCLLGDIEQRQARTK